MKRSVAELRMESYGPGAVFNGKNGESASNSSRNAGFRSSALLAIVLPFVFILAAPFACSYFHILQIKNLTLYAFIVTIANAILTLKIVLSDYVKQFDMYDHSVQLTEMALTAYLATLALEILKSDEHSVFTQTVLEYPLTTILSVGLAITAITTAITAINSQKTRERVVR